MGVISFYSVAVSITQTVKVKLMFPRVSKEIRTISVAPLVQQVVKIKKSTHDGEIILYQRVYKCEIPE